MIDQLVRLLSPAQRAVLDSLRRMCGVPLFLVGGPVRDLILNRKILDLDFAVESDVESLARALAESSGGELTLHPRFHTANIRFPDGVAVDLAQTRRERYPEPARLPQVCVGASIEEDLARRDFSIQAMALRLNGRDCGKIVDPFGGRKDIAAGIIRILHASSFQDDPVRAFRAVRYAARYGFRLEKNTSGALAAILRRPELLKCASDRIFDEWRRTFDEPRWIENMRQLCKRNLLRWISIGSVSKFRTLLRTDASLKKLSGSYPDMPAWVARWSAFLALCPPARRLAVSARMPFRRQIKKIFAFQGNVGRVVVALNADQMPPSRAVELLEGVPPEWLVVLHARSQTRARRRIEQFVSDWRIIPPPLTGDDLRRMGVPPGPAYPKILQKLHAAKIDGRLHGPEDVKRIVSAFHSMT